MHGGKRARGGGGGTLQNTGKVRIQTHAIGMLKRDREKERRLTSKKWAPRHWRHPITESTVTQLPKPSRKPSP